MKLLLRSRKIRLTYMLVFIGFSSMAQLSATFNTTINTNCNGTGCNYSGPSILINELMISPTVNDGSISGNANCGEWIELYNPDLCESIDISCYYLGNNTAEGTGGFVIPAGTIVPPAGFAMIRGQNVAPVPANLLVQNGGNVVEIVVPYFITDPGVCTSGNRVWFPNAGGWFAFYDNNGVPQDAVSWANSDGVAGSPCIASLAGCTAVASLSNYDNIPANRKEYISNINASLHLGNSLRRFPDGGNWNGNGAPTYATCNGPCILPGSSTCTGTATINVSGGTAPYTYLWSDSEVQTTQTAIDLCADTYQVTVTDALGQSQQFDVTIIDFVPVVSVSLTEEVCIDNGNVPVSVSPVASGSAVGNLTGSGISGSDFDPQAAGAGNYTITYDYTDEFGCTNNASDQITVHPLPIVTISGNSSPYCMSATPVNFNLSPAGGQLSINGINVNSFIPANEGVGVHSMTYTYTDANGCENSATTYVEVVAVPSPVLTLPSPICDDAAAFTMQATPAGGVFSMNGNTISNTFNPATTGPGTHQVTYLYTDANQCVSSVTETIVVLPPPSLNLNVQSAYCFETGIVNLNPSPAGGTLSGDNIFGSGLNLSGVDPGTYTVQYDYTDNDGCSNTINSNYIVTHPIEPSFIFTTDCFQQLNLQASPISSSYAYSWVSNGMSASNSLTTMQYELPGTHLMNLTITDNYNCSYTISEFVDVPQGLTMSDFVVPNVITPNGDQVNDELTMPLLLNECIEYSIIIVNRWGNTVYELHSDGAPFAGKDQNGDELNQGVYFYKVISSDIDCSSDQYKGFCHGLINIVR